MKFIRLGPGVLSDHSLEEPSILIGEGFRAPGLSKSLMVIILASVRKTKD